ncbi:MAG: energy transducer TonB [Bacteroidota bacterium]|nr:energy transducer TonB [Bacteroidota bacterium]
METKKANHANLEKKRTIFLQVGFIISLTLVLMAFEWTVEKSAAKVFDGLAQVEMEEDMVNTFQKEPEKIEKPKPKLKVTDIINIIVDSDEPDDVLDFSSETDQNEWVDTNFELDDETGEDLKLFIIVEDMPIFRPDINNTIMEGNADLHRFVLRKAVYPELAREQGIFGKVWVKFIVDKKGKVTEVAIERGIDPLLDNEALRVVRELPDFSPGRQLGKAVKVLFRVPINFRLG